MERTVVGTLTGMEPRNGGWVRFSITEPGKQYPAVGDTKKPEIVAAAQALMGQHVAARINEEDSGNPNPHRPGTNYVNRYLNEITMAVPGQVSDAPATAPPPAAQPQTVAPQAQPVQAQHIVPEHERTRQIRIMRQHASNMAVLMMPLLPAEQRTSVALVEVAETWMAYYVHGPARFGVQAFGGITQPPGPAQPPGGSPPSGPAQPAQPEQQQLGDPGPMAPPVGEEVPTYVCPDCGTTDPQQHANDCIPF